MVDREAGDPISHPSEAYSPRRRMWMLFILFLVSSSSYLDRNLIGVVLEPIKEEFHTSDAMLGLLSGASFAILYVTLGIPVARWADRGDRRLIVTLSLAIWSVMTVLCGVATSFWQLLIARMGVGAGEAGAMAPAQSLLADYFPPAQRGRAIGFFMLSVTVGTFLGLVGGGWVTERFGWRALFLVVGLPGLLLVPLVFFTLKEPRLTNPVVSSPEELSTVLRILQSKSSYALAVIAMALFFAVAFGPMSFAVPFIMRVHALSVGQSAMIVGLCTAMGGIAGNVLGGILTDRLAARDIRWICWIPAIGVITICLCYEIAFIAPSIEALVVALLFGNLLSGAAYPPMYSLIHAVCGSRRRVMAIAVALFVGNLVGIGLGPLFVGFMSDALSPSVGTADGLRYALMIASLMLIPSGILFIQASRRVRAELED